LDPSESVVNSGLKNYSHMRRPT